MIRIALDFETDTFEEVCAVLGLLGDLGIEATVDLGESRPRPNLVAVPSPERGAAS